MGPKLVPRLGCHVPKALGVAQCGGCGCKGGRSGRGVDRAPLRACGRCGKVSGWGAGYWLGLSVVNRVRASRWSTGG